mgnify:CR=1 FL=1
MAKKSRSPKKTFLWVTDPWQTLDHAHDTTLRLAEAAQRLGHRSLWSAPPHWAIQKGKLAIQAAPLEKFGAADMPTGFSTVASSAFHQLHYRVDPPVDDAYRAPLESIVTLGDSKLSERVINPLKALLTRSSKLEPLALPGFNLPTVMSADRAALLRGLEQMKDAVIKPMNSAQSKGVVRVSVGGGSETVIREATQGFKQPVLMQPYLKEIQGGEMRLWFIDGHCLGALRKFPLKGDFRVLIDEGSRTEGAELTPRLKAQAKSVGAHLKRHGMRIAAVDWIGDHVTDFNFTSPGLLRELERAHQKPFAEEIIDRLARKG